LEFTKILVSSKQDLQSFKSEGIPDEKLALIGNPLTFEIKYGKSLHNSKVERDSVNILWAPHWDSSWSNWEATLPKVMELLDSNSSYKLTFRPHPLLMPGIKGSLPKGYRAAVPEHSISVRTIVDFLRRENVHLSTSSLILDIQENDLLLTDGVSIIGFWYPTGKPIAVFRRLDSPQFSNQISPIVNSIDFIHEPFNDLTAWVSTHQYQSTGQHKLSSPIEIVYSNELPIEPAKLFVKAFQ
jgi:hypothetical protein